jgi:hypothetical protein
MKIARHMLLAMVALTALAATPASPQPPPEGRVSAPPADAAAVTVHKGMTWKWISKNATTGTVDVGCDNCGAYQGDTSCKTALPILCIKKSGPGFPLPVPVGVNNSDQYHKWTGGIVATTAPIVPPATLAAADALCAQDFGPGWRVAEFHDGWGWHFQAYGGVGNQNQHFWVHINDQPGALCW